MCLRTGKERLDMQLEEVKKEENWETELTKRATIFGKRTFRCSTVN